ncbi:MAG: electron transport complex subunit RsxC [Bacteroidales bacterium]|nr:electron transport complex subunit RsxC [Bacteroidales bacterium]
MKTFKIGGVHPEAQKLSNEVSVETFPLPKQATVFVTQSLGAPAVPVVAKGDKVKVGQLLAKAEAFICANVHSPFSGTVNKIEPVADFTGYKKPAIVIDVEGDEWDESIDTTEDIVSEIKLGREEIIERMKACGIVGLGGASFPTHVKYMLPPGKSADFILVNAAECEPYITTDYRMMLEQTEACLIGVEALLIASGAKQALIGIENNKPEAIKKLKEAVKTHPKIEIVPLKTKYPQGAEKQLIQALTGRTVPNGKLPIDVGCIVNNIATTHAVYEAVQKNKPLIETYTTITGKKLEKRKNYKIRLGTPLKDVLDTVGIPENTGKIISGGPMMGKAIANTNTFFVKGMSSILFLDASESKRVPESGCIRCGKCIQACPMGLEPYLFRMLAVQHRLEDLEAHGIMNCIECGCCQSGCPAHIPLLDTVKTGKSQTGTMIKSRQAKKS